MVKYIAICQIWEESERGWGIRPDGYSLHINKTEANTFAAKFLKWQHEYFESKGIMDTPEEYTRKCGEPYETLISKEAYNQLLVDKSMRFYDKYYPEKKDV